MRRIVWQCVAALMLLVLDPKIVPAQEKALTDAYNASGQQLSQQFSKAPGNIVFSPYSIGTAMAMALSGARGATEAEMSKVLMQTLSRTAMDRANGKVLATLNGYDKSAVPPACPPGMTVDGRDCKSPRPASGCEYPAREVGQQCVVPGRLPPSAKLAVANALMLTKSGGAIVSPEYAALLKDKYAAEVFRNINLATVNDWVKRKTEGKIEQILDQLDKDAAAVLLNAVYFKAGWASPFAKSLTKDDVFSLTASQQIKVPTMRQTGTYALIGQQNFRAIRIPYSVRSIGLIVVLPDKVDGVREVASELSTGLPNLVAKLRSVAPVKVALSMPRYKTSFRADLVPAFKAEGMKLAFTDSADFSGMIGRSSARGGLKIGQIVHRALIEVDEEGSEAAAATAIVMMPTSAMPRPEPEPVPFKVDRPFLFYLVDDATGAVLFQGRIMDPRQ